MAFTMQKRHLYTHPNIRDSMLDCSNLNIGNKKGNKQTRQSRMPCGRTVVSLYVTDCIIEHCYMRLKQLSITLESISLKIFSPASKRMNENHMIRDDSWIKTCHVEYLTSLSSMTLCSLKSRFVFGTALLLLLLFMSIWSPQHHVEIDYFLVRERSCVAHSNIE